MNYKVVRVPQDVDFSKVPATSFEPLPEGIYPLQIDKAEAWETKAGKPAVRLEMSAKHEKGARKVFEYLLFTGNDEEGTTKALKRIANLCNILGVETPRAGTELQPFADSLAAASKRRALFAYLYEQKDERGSNMKVRYYSSKAGEAKADTASEDAAPRLAEVGRPRR